MMKRRAIVNLVILKNVITVLLISLWVAGSAGRAEGMPKFSAFIFGDSLVDPGNNRYIASTSRADWSPYGVDFAPSGFLPTGRFTNGRTLADIIVQELGLEELPQPYLAPTTHGDTLLNGVNYASGAGGILEDSGTVFFAHLSFDTQIKYFINTKMELVSMLGEDRTIEFLNRSMFVVVFGSNDYLDNYLLPFSNTKAQYSPQDYKELLISHFGDQLNRLYQLGGRKFIVAGIGPLGCIPYQLSNSGSVNGECIAATNQLLNNYNKSLKDLIINLNSNTPDATYVYINCYDAAHEVVQSYERFGMINVNTACCGIGGRFKGRITCIPHAPYCGEDRHKYLFFDAYHPTEAANLIFADKFLNGGPRYAFPINIRSLAAI